MGRYDYLFDGGPPKQETPIAGPRDLAPPQEEPRFGYLFDAPPVPASSGATLALRAAADTNPDQHGEATRLGRQFGVPPALVSEYPEAYRVRAAMEAARPVLERSPRLSSWIVSRPDRAALVSDDVQSLGGIEGGVGSLASFVMGARPDGGLPGMVGRSLQAFLSGGAISAAEAIHGRARAVFELLGMDEQAEAAAERARYSHGRAAKIAEETASQDSILGRGYTSGLMSAGRSLIDMAGGGWKGAMTLVQMGLSTFGSSYQKAREAGAGLDKAWTLGVTDAVAEVVTERYAGAYGLLKDAKAGMGLARLFMRDIAREIPGEMSATLWQNYNEWTVLNPEKSLGEFLAEQPEALLETIVATVVAGGAQSGAIRGVQKALGDVERRAAQAREADAAAGRIAELSTLAEASKLKARDAGSFRDLVADIADEDGDAPTELFVSGVDLARVLDQSAITMQELAAVAPVVAEQMREAQADTMVRVPVSEFLAAGEKVTAPLVEFMRTAPDAMSRAEATEYLKGHDASAAAAVEAAVSSAEEADQYRQQIEAVMAGIEQQLTATGRFRAPVVKAFAQTMAAYYGTTAVRAGMTPEQFAQAYGVLVRGQTAGGAQVLNQQVPTDTPQFKAWFGDSTVVDAQGKPQVMYHGTGADVESFRPNRLGLIFLTHDAGMASTFARKRGGAPNIMPVYVSAAKPFDGARAADRNEVLGAMSEEEMTAALRLLHASEQDYRVTDARQQMAQALGDEYANWRLIEQTAVLAAIRARGFDGVRVREHGRDNLAVFSSTQIKSVFNRGTFDPNDQNILNQGARKDWVSKEPTPEERKRLKVPPGWTDVRVAVDPGSWLIATGRDSKGRAVSMRSAEFDAGQLRKKFERQRAFNKALPGLMAQIERDAAAGNEAASVLRLIAHTGFRVGGKGDGRAAVEAFGASTLKAEHVFINGDTVSFSFAGKKGVRQEHSIVDATLARDLSARMDRPQLFATTDQKVRDYLHSLDGGADYKVHDFRTWNATEAARQAIAAIPTPTDPASFWAAYDLVGDAAAAKIGDTRAVALESYVDPTVFTEWRIATGVEEGSARPNRGRKAANDAAAAGADAGVPGDTPLPAAPEGGSLEQGAAESGPSLFHGEQDPRAQISLPQSFDLGPAVITLLAGADRSSFIHESGHLFLEVHLDVAGKIQRQINAGASVSEGERGIVEDVRKLLSWFGITDTPEQSALDRWASLSFEERRPLHEQFARGFEAYAFEGKAPSIELRGVFRQFASWLKQIYRTLRGLDVELTADVRGVMDRMLASDEAIAEAEALRAMGPLFRSAEQAGMTLKEFEAYQALGKKPTDEAIEDLQTRTLRDMRWVSRARERALTEREKEVEAIRRETRMRVRAEVYGEPVYAAWQFLTGKDVEDVGEHGKLNANVLREMYGTDETAIWRKLSALRMTNETGLDPEVVAERFDFDSGDALVKALADAVPPNEVIEARTDERMLEEHGDITSPEALARAADEAVFNDARARFVAAEVKALRDAMKLRTGPRATVDALARAARDFAAQIIGRQRVRDLRPGQYAAAAARSARLAQASFGADKVDEAAMHKRNQLVNTYAAKAAVAAKQEVEKALRYLRKFDGEVSGLEQEYHDQIDQLLEGLDLRTPSNREADRRRSLSEWVAEQQALGMVPSLSPELMAQVGRKSYRDMTLDELREVVDSVKEIEHLGRLKNRLLTAASKRDFDSTVADMVGSIVQHGGKPREVKLEGQDRGLRYWAESFAAQHRKLASLFRQMDGNNDAGPLWENIGRPMNERGTREEVMIEQATERLQALYAPLLGMQGGITGARSKVFIPEIGASLTRGGRLAVALNWGNEINRERMRADPVGKWTDEKVRAVFRTLTAEELAFVNGAWEFLDSYWPEVADKQRRVTGTAPEKVEASAFVAVGAGGIEVPMRGGYYPLKYQDVRAEQQEAVQTAKDMARGAMANATTRRGHTKERLQNVKRNLRLDLDVITQHTNEVIHDLVWHEWLIDVNRIVKDERFAAAVETHYGRQVLQTIRNDIDGIAAGDLTRQTAVDKALLTLRGNISRATMGFSVTTALLQPFGLTQSMYRIGAKWVLKGGARWAGDAVRFESTARWVNEKSDFMRLRGKTMNRELREIAQRVGGKSKPAQVWDAALFYFMRKAQLIADIPTWVGQYEKTLAEGPKTNDEAGRAELEARAVAMADRAVLESQGGGQMKDLAEVQRKHPMLTQFYSYFSTTLNLAVESTAATNFKSPAAVVGWVGDMMLLLVIPAILPAMLTYALKGGGGDDDEASMLKRALKWQAGYMLGLLVGMRETSGLIEGFDYSGPPVGRVVSLAGRAGKQTAQGEIDEPLVLAYANLIGTAFGIPMVQLTRMYKGWKAWHEGDPRASAASVLMGPPPKD